LYFSLGSENKWKTGGVYFIKQHERIEFSFVR